MYVEFRQPLTTSFSPLGCSSSRAISLQVNTRNAITPCTTTLQNAQSRKDTIDLKSSGLRPQAQDSSILHSSLFSVNLPQPILVTSTPPIHALNNDGCIETSIHRPSHSAYRKTTSPSLDLDRVLLLMSLNPLTSSDASTPLALVWDRPLIRVQMDPLHRRHLCGSDHHA